MNKKILESYQKSAPQLIDRFDAISSSDLYAPLGDFLPQTPARILDVGAGSGRDAAWFASFGHHVLAAEPVAAFRDAGTKNHPSPDIEWIDDLLPGLPHVSARGETFDLITLTAVWHHLDETAQAQVFPTLRCLISKTGKIVLSLRHDPTNTDAPLSLASIIAHAHSQGFEKTQQIAAPSVQKGNQDAGVTWTWLVFQAP